MSLCPESIELIVCDLNLESSSYLSLFFENWLKLFYFPSSFKNLKYKQFTSNSMTSFPVCNPSRSARPPFMQRLCKFSHILRWFLSLQTRLVTAIKCRRSQANTAHTRQQAFKALTCEITCRRHSLPPLVWERNMYAVQCAGRGKLLLCLRWMLENEYQVGERLE